MINASSSVFRQLFKVSVFTSLLVAMMSIIVLYLTARITDAYMFFALVFVIVFANLNLIWLINIGLLAKFMRKGARGDNNPLRYVLSYVVVVTTAGFLMLWVNSFNLVELLGISEDQLPPHQRSDLGPFIMAFFSNSFVLVVQEMILLRDKKMHIELENAQLKVEKIEAINQQLRHHIHPHFLFNSLSILKSLIHTNSELAEEYVMRLSDFLRVSVVTKESDLVPLTQELKLCQDYTLMQKIRFGEALQVNIQLPESLMRSSYVPGFSLQLLLENAIKHNVLTLQKPLVIQVEEGQGWLCVRNNLQTKQYMEDSPRTGLANLSQRYRILCGQDIVISQDESQFMVKIKLLEHANRYH